MRLIPGTAATVKLNDDEYNFTLVAADGDGNGRLNVAAPLLGMMTPGDVVKAWTPSVPGARPIRVELVEAIRCERQ